MGTSKWSKDRIASRVKAWDKRHQAPPRGADWKYSGADEDGAFPSEATVKRVFGSWNKAIEAANLPTRSPGRPRGASVPITLTSNAASSFNLYGGSSCQPYYWTTTPCTSCAINQAAVGKVNALKAILDADPNASTDVLLAILNS